LFLPVDRLIGQGAVVGVTLVARVVNMAVVHDPHHEEHDERADGRDLNRTCRRRGETVRKLIDCLIASVAIRADTPVLHADSDFDALARHMVLRIDQP